MLSEPCRRLRSVERWNGHAPHVTIGTVSRMQSTSQPGKPQTRHQREQDREVTHGNGKKR